jgi:MFS family permease
MLRVLRDNRDLRLLFVAQNLSFLGDWFTFVALAGLVQDVTESKLLVSLLLVAFSLPSFLASPIGGPAADRYDRRRLLVWISLAQAVAAACLLLAGESRIWIAFVAQAVIAALAAGVRPAVEAALPNVARDPDELRRANALFGSSWGVMLAVGAGAGGLFAAATRRSSPTSSPSSSRRASSRWSARRCSASARAPAPACDPWPTCTRPSTSRAPTARSSR